MELRINNNFKIEKDGKTLVLFEVPPEISNDCLKYCPLCYFGQRKYANLLEGEVAASCPWEAKNNGFICDQSIFLPEKSEIHQCVWKEEV
jgi:hypothetical protein